MKTKRATLLPLAIVSFIVVSHAAAQTTYTPYTFITLAGLAGSSGTNDGTGNSARFNWPHGVAADDSGNVYVADRFNSTIRKVTPAGVVTTLAGKAGTSGSTDGTGSSARFNSPYGLATDVSNNVYVSDNYMIRRVSPAGIVTTLAGKAATPGSTDGTNNGARFGIPIGITLDAGGNIYVADTGSNTIRKITPLGTNWVVTTLAGLPGVIGTNDGVGDTARFRAPFGVAVDGATNVYVADTDNNMIRKVTPDGVVTTLAGMYTDSNGGYVDGTNAAARFEAPVNLAVDSETNIFVIDTNNQAVRKIKRYGTNWVTTTVAGVKILSGSADGIGPLAQFDHPHGIALDSAGNIYVGDTFNNTIRMGFQPTNAAPVIYAQPQGQVVALNGTAIITVGAAAAGPIYYQWFKNGGVVPGATNESLTLTGVMSDQLGRYSVIVSNAFGNLTSSNALLAIDNDLFANRLLIAGATNTSFASNVGASNEPGEPEPTGLGNQSVWWSWIAPASGLVTVDTTGSSIFAVLAVFTGNVLTNLTLVADDVGSGDDGFSSKLAFAAGAGITYQISVNGFFGDSGDIVLNLRQASAPGTVIIASGGSFGFSNGHFGFNITGVQGQTVVFDASTNLQNWVPIQTNTFGDGPLHFSDPQSGFSGRQFYRARMP